MSLQLNIATFKNVVSLLGIGKAEISVRHN